MRSLFGGALTVVLILVLAESASAGAWMQGPGHGYNKIAFSSIRGTNNFSSSGDVEPMSDGGLYQEAALNVYIEQGLRPNVDLIVNGTFKRAEFSNDVGSDQATIGLGDLFLGTRLGSLKSGPFLAAGLVQLKIPMGYEDGQTPPLGAGQVDLDLRFVGSASFWPFPGYATAEFGYRFRRDFANEVPYFFEVGVDLGSRTWLRFTATGVDSRGSTPDTGEELALRVREEDWLKIGPGFALPLDDWLAIELSYFRAVWGRSTIESNEFTVGVSFIN